MLNPVFVILVFFSGIFVFLLLSGIYKFIGKFFWKLIGDAKDAITEDDEKNFEKENKNHE